MFFPHGKHASSAPPPDARLTASTTLEQLKLALLGKAGRAGNISGTTVTGQKTINKTIKTAAQNGTIISMALRKPLWNRL